MHEIGLELRSTAVCKGVRRTRDGPFHLQDALTHHHWTATDVMHAIGRYHSAKKRTTARNPQSQIKDPGLQPPENTTTSQQNGTNTEEVQTVQLNKTAARR